MRCGPNSSQCIHAGDRCNGIMDCENGWDESFSACMSAFPGWNFVSGGDGFDLQIPGGSTDTAGSES